MDILAHHIISKEVDSRSYFDLKSNNKRLNVIVPLVNDPVQKLKEIFKQILDDEKSSNNYYELQNLFTSAQMVEPDIILNLVIEIVNNKINIIRNTIFNDNEELDDINLAMYIQIWKTYRDFSRKLYNLIKNYQNHLVEKKIKCKNIKITHDILSIIQICMFYSSIIEKPGDLLIKVSQDLSEIDKNNIEQLIDYIDSIRVFMIMREFTKIDREKLSNIIKNIMNKTSIINIMCAHTHNLLKSLTNKQKVIDESEYETVVANDADKQIIRKLYKIATILSTYAEKSKLLTCYSKFMQTRIIDLSYDNLELEIELVRRISGLLGKETSQKLIDTIADIINSKNANNAMHIATINVKTEEYKKMINITPKIINPVILTKNIWQIYNVSDMEPIYPLELKCYFDIIDKCYANIFKNEYIINWQPTLGCARFEAKLGSKKIDITCNILQSIALIYLNDCVQTTVESFAENILINPELAAKIFESLFEANLVIYQLDGPNNMAYAINLENYTGETKIDIRQTFIDVFAIEIDGDKEKEDEENEENEDENEEKKENWEKEMPKMMTYSEFYQAKYKELDEDYTVDERNKIIKKAWSEYINSSLINSIENTNDSEYSCDDSENTECSCDAWDYPEPKIKKMSKPKKMPQPKSEYQIFIGKKLKELREKTPGLKNNEYMKRAAAEWIKIKQNIGKKKEEDSSDNEPCPKKYMKQAAIEWNKYKAAKCKKVMDSSESEEENTKLVSKKIFSDEEEEMIKIESDKKNSKPKKSKKISDDEE